MANDATRRQRLLGTLTGREQEVLRHLCAGKSPEEAGDEMSPPIARRTVLLHLQHIYEKFEIVELRRNQRQRQLQMYCVDLETLGQDTAVPLPEPEATSDEAPRGALSASDASRLDEEWRAIVLATTQSLTPRRAEVITVSTSLWPVASGRRRLRAGALAVVLLVAILVASLGAAGALVGERFLASQPALNSAAVQPTTKGAPPLAPQQVALAPTRFLEDLAVVQGDHAALGLATISGQTFAHSLRYVFGSGLRGQSKSTTYTLGGRYQSFQARLGLEKDSEFDVRFEVFVDGKRVFDQTVATTDAPLPMSPDIRGAGSLRLTMTLADLRGHSVSTVAVWGDATVVGENEAGPGAT